jgi:hypothetical protein
MRTHPHTLVGQLARQRPSDVSIVLAPAGRPGPGGVSGNYSSSTAYLYLMPPVRRRAQLDKIAT